jgi:hypothetical protein
MSAKAHSKSGRKSCYRRHPISARGSNRKGVATRQTCFLLPDAKNANGSNRLAKVTGVTFWPTTERALALLRGSDIRCYFPRGHFGYFLSLGCGVEVCNPKVSRACQGSYDPGLSLGGDPMLRIECKARAAGFRQPATPLTNVRCRSSRQALRSLAADIAQRAS